MQKPDTFTTYVYLWLGTCPGTFCGLCSANSDSVLASMEHYTTCDPASKGCCPDCGPEQKDPLHTSGIQFGAPPGSSSTRQAVGSTPPFFARFGSMCSDGLVGVWRFCERLHPPSLCLRASFRSFTRAPHLQTGT